MFDAVRRMNCCNAACGTDSLSCGCSHEELSAPYDRINCGHVARLPAVLPQCPKAACMRDSQPLAMCMW